MKPSLKNDIFLYGLIILSMYNGRIITNYPIIVPEYLPNIVKTFLSQCLSPENNRPSSETLMANVYVKHFQPMENVWAGIKVTKTPRTISSVGYSMKSDDLIYKNIESKPKDDLIKTSRLESEFQSFQPIGYGGFGSVIMARNKLDNCVYAIKRVPLPPSYRYTQNIATLEVQILSRLNHDNIVRYYNSWLDNDTAQKIFPDLEEDVEDSVSSESRDEFKEQSVENNKFLNTENNKNKPQSNPNENSNDSNNIQRNFSDDSEIDFMEYLKHLSSGSSEVPSTPSESHFDCSSDGGVIFEDDTKEVFQSTPENTGIYDFAILDNVTGQENLKNTEKGLLDRNSQDHLASQHRSISKDSKIKKTKIKKDPHHDKIFFYIQMEFCEKKTLREVINNEHLDDNHPRILMFLRGILNGITYMHEKGLIHRDIKPGNIFIDIKDNPKIGDFGLSKIKNEIKINDDENVVNNNHGVDSAEKKPKRRNFSEFSVMELDNMFTSLESQKNEKMDSTVESEVGTFIYNAPELYRGNYIGHSAKSDIYSIGLVFYEMCRPPFNSTFARYKMLTALKNNAWQEPPDILDETQISLLKMMLHPEPEKRYKSREILESALLPSNMLGHEFDVALNHILANNDDSKRFRSLFDSVYNSTIKKRMFYSKNNFKTSYEYGFMNAKSFSFKCLKKVVETFIEKSSFISPKVPYSNFIPPELFSLAKCPSNPSECKFINKDALLSFGNYLSKIESSLIPLDLISDYSGIITYFNSSIDENKLKIDHDSRNPSMDEDINEITELYFLKISQKTLEDQVQAITKTIRECCKFINILIKKASLITPHLSLGKGRGLQCIPFISINEYYVILNDIQLIMDILDHYKIDDVLHPKIVNILLENKGTKRKEKIFQMLKESNIDQSTRKQIVKFLTFKGTFEELKTLFGSTYEVISQYFKRIELITECLKQNIDPSRILICTYQLIMLKHFAGYVNFVLKYLKSDTKLTKSSSKTSLEFQKRTLAFGGTCSVSVFNESTYKESLNVSSPFASLTSDNSNSGSFTDDLLISYGSFNLDSIINCNLIFHQNGSCFLENDCLCQKMVIVNYFKYSSFDVNSAHINNKNNMDELEILENGLNSLGFKVISMASLVPFEITPKITSFFFNLRILSIINFRFKNPEIKINCFDYSKKAVVASKFENICEVLEFFGNKIHHRLSTGDENTPRITHETPNHATRVFGSDSTVFTTIHKKTATNVNYFILIEDRMSSSNKKKMESKASLAINHLMPLVNMECRVNVYIVSLTCEEFSFVVMNTFPNSSKKIPVKKDLDILLKGFNSNSKTRINSILNRLVKELNDIEKSKSSVFICLYNNEIDQLRIIS